MMRKILCATAVSVACMAASCIFQNDPLELNRSPVIDYFDPQTTYFSLVIPDSCTFTLAASDPDGDEVRIRWFEGDSLIGASESITFHATNAGDCLIRGEARDGTRRVIRDWHVRVISKEDKPPVIEYFSPEQTRVACAVGDTLSFRLKAADDNPASLQYIYRLDGSVAQTGPADFVRRFGECGEFVLDGIAWDGLAGDTMTWNIDVTGEPDTIAPGAILDLAGGPGELDGSIALEWTAPGDDGYEGRASIYIVRTSVYPILSESDWSEAEGKLGEPVPSVAGTKERMVIRNLVSASYVYVAMRAVDDFLNLSPLGNCAKVTVRGIDVAGRIWDAGTGEALPGIIVTASTKSDTSGADGSYFLENIPSYATWISARDELLYGQAGAYYDVVRTLPPVAQLITLDLHMIGVYGLVSTVEPDEYYLGRFLSFFKGITNTTGEAWTSTVYRGWNHWPLAVHSPAFVWRGVDLRAASLGAMNDWESSALIDFFVEVESPDAADVVVIYDTIADFKHHVRTVAYNPDGTPSRKEIWISTQHAEVPVTTYGHLIFAHELGHVIGFDHSRNVGHLMVGLTMPQVHHPTADEVNAVRCLLGFPNIFDYSFVHDD